MPNVHRLHFCRNPAPARPLAALFGRELTRPKIGPFCRTGGRAADQARSPRSVLTGCSCSCQCPRTNGRRPGRLAASALWLAVSRIRPAIDGCGLIAGTFLGIGTLGVLLSLLLAIAFFLCRYLVRLAAELQGFLALLERSLNDERVAALSFSALDVVSLDFITFGPGVGFRSYEDRAFDRFRLIAFALHEA